MEKGQKNPRKLTTARISVEPDPDAMAPESDETEIEFESGGSDDNDDDVADGVDATVWERL